MVAYSHMRLITFLLLALTLASCAPNLTAGKGEVIYKTDTSAKFQALFPNNPSLQSQIKAFRQVAGAINLHMQSFMKLPDGYSKFTGDMKDTGGVSSGTFIATKPRAAGEANTEPLSVNMTWKALDVATDYVLVSVQSTSTDPSIDLTALENQVFTALDDLYPKASSGR